MPKAAPLDEGAYFYFIYIYIYIYTEWENTFKIRADIYRMGEYVQNTCRYIQKGKIRSKYVQIYTEWENTFINYQECASKHAKISYIAIYIYIFLYVAIFVASSGS